MGLFGPPNVAKAQARGRIEDMVRAAKYKKDPAVAAAGRDALAEHIDTLIKELDTRNLRRLRIAREALVLVGPRARDRLVFILGEGHVHRRQDAAFVLGEMKDEEAVAPLCAAVRHPDPLLRLLCVQALGKIGSVQAASTLRRAAGDPDPKVAAEARKALVKISTAAPGPDS
jgi:HEAT repeat protein